MYIGFKNWENMNVHHRQLKIGSVRYSLINMKYSSSFLILVTTKGKVTSSINNKSVILINKQVKVVIILVDEAKVLRAICANADYL